MANEADPEPAHTSPRQALLGVFILCQLAFLIVANLLPFIKWVPKQLKDKPKALVGQAAPGLNDDNAHGGNWTGQIETNLSSWTRFVGHEQNWSLFAPSVHRGSGFPVVVLIWDEPSPDTPFIKGTRFAYDETNGYHLCAPWNPSARDLPLPVEQPERVEVVLSDNEPADVANFFRFGKCRLRLYEGQFYVNLQVDKDNEETPAGLERRATDRVHGLVKDYHDPMLKYMKWRLEAWQAANPGQSMPKQVLLCERFYEISAPKPGETRHLNGPILYPLARWVPGRTVAKGTRVLEPFDYTEQHFPPMGR